MAYQTTLNLESRFTDLLQLEPVITTQSQKIAEGVRSVYRLLRSFLATSTECTESHLNARLLAGSFRNLVRQAGMPSSLFLALQMRPTDSTLAGWAFNNDAQQMQKAEHPAITEKTRVLLRSTLCKVTRRNIRPINPFSSVATALLRTDNDIVKYFSTLSPFTVVCCSFPSKGNFTLTYI
jgi:hypothetical protein